MPRSARSPRPPPGSMRCGYRLLQMFPLIKPGCRRQTFGVLDAYRLLGRSGLRVSPLALGTMTFGWGADKDEARAIFDAYVGRGGNFVDTANGYADGTAEELVGWFARGRREALVLATKYSMPMRPGDPNSGGNSRKCMVRSVEASLTRLGTDYLDLLYLHIWDGATPVE